MALPPVERDPTLIGKARAWAATSAFLGILSVILSLVACQELNTAIRHFAEALFPRRPGPAQAVLWVFVAVVAILTVVVTWRISFRLFRRHYQKEFQQQWEEEKLRNQKTLFARLDKLRGHLEAYLKFLALLRRELALELRFDQRAVQSLLESAQRCRDNIMLFWRIYRCSLRMSQLAVEEELVLTADEHYTVEVMNPLCEPSDKPDDEVRRAAIRRAAFGVSCVDKIVARAHDRVTCRLQVAGGQTPQSPGEAEESQA